MRLVDWGFVAAGLMTAGAVVTLIGGSPGWAGLLVISALVLLGLLIAWSRRHPGPMPYAWRWILRISPLATARLKGVLNPRAGEHLLEIGPGVGHHAIAIAPDLLPAGELEVIDVQQAMLDAVMDRVGAAGITNVFARQADATDLPFQNASFDGAYLSAVLGEIPNRDRALRELHRVLRTGGRLVVSEVLIDPDYIPLRRLIREAAAAGFRFEKKKGNAVAFAARFVR